MLGINKTATFSIEKYLPLKSMISFCSENSAHKRDKWYYRVWLVLQSREVFIVQSEATFIIKLGRYCKVRNYYKVVQYKRQMRETGDGNRF